MTAIRGNSVMVVGRPTAWPTARSRWPRPNRVKSGMLSESVDQKAIMAIRAGGNVLTQKSEPQPSLPESLRIGPRPPAWLTIQMQRKIPTIRTNGAAQFSKWRMAFMPRTMMKMLRTQKTRKLSHIVHGCEDRPKKSIEGWAAFVHELPMMAPMSTKIALPPIQVWIPNQPQATPARTRAGRLAPMTPNDARANTGNGMPYFVPAWLFASMGISTTMLAIMIVRIAWYQAIPRAIRPAARVHVATLWAMPIHRAM